MKKKLLTVLLAVVMVFGVFGLTACKGSNADADYNYYGVKYEIEDEVKIEAVTFQAVYKMFTTAGKFLLYVDSGADKANYQAINKLATDWDVTIYHFNPDLTGGYAKDLSNAVNANLCTDLTGIAAESQLKAVQDLLFSVSNKKLADWKGYEGKLLGITGAESTASASGALQYKGAVTAANTIADGAKSIAAVAVKNPSYGAYTEEERDIPYIPEAYETAGINTMNLFGDARLHMYNDDNGVDALLDAKEDVYVTVANYEMFAHLLDNNEGYFAVFFGGTWCPNTQAIAKATNDIAKDYGIEKIYFFDPRLDDGVRLDQVASTTTWSQEQKAADVDAAYQAYLKAVAAKEAAEKDYTDYKGTEYAKLLAAVKAAEDAEKAADKAWKDAKDKVIYAQIAKEELASTATQAQKDAAQEAIDDAEDVADEAKETLDEASEDLSDAEAAVAAYEDAQTSLANACDDYVAKYEFNTVDTKFVIGKVVAQFEAAAKAKTDKDEKAAAEALAANVKLVAADSDVMEALYKAISDKEDAEDKAEQAWLAAKENGGYVTTYEVQENKGNVTGNLNTRAKDATGSAYNYNFTYGSFLKNYLNTYKSEWNITGDNNNIPITVGSETAIYTRMCVPNIMMFNGEEDGKAELVALAEAEYTYGNVSVEGNPEQIAWTTAVKAVFDANPYAVYNPVVVVEEAPAADAGSSSAGSSAGAAAGGAAEAC